MSEREGNEIRQELLQTIVRLSDKYPSLRVTQLLGNSHGGEHIDLYYIEDSRLLNWLLLYETRADQAILRASTKNPGQ